VAQTPDAGIFLKSTEEEEVHAVQLNPSTITALEMWRQQQAEHKRQFEKDYNDQDLIFAMADGSFLNPAYVSQIIKRRLQKAGITTGSLHSLRHTNATLMHDKKVPMATVSARLGHSDINTTRKTYTHAVAEDDELAAEVWEEIIQDADKWEGVSGREGPVQ
jgi:integrase